MSTQGSSAPSSSGPSSALVADWYEQWIATYKVGAVQRVTLGKYTMALKRLREIAPDLRLADLDRMAYQRIINAYAVDHEKATVTDFHHCLKGALLDALDEGLLERDPTRKVVLKGKPPGKKKQKYLSVYELQSLLRVLKLDGEHNWDWCILIAAKTGLRFAEVLGLTPADFDFERQLLNVDKTWDYKGGGGFKPTKTGSSVRKVTIDWQMVGRLSVLTKDMPPDDPIFVPKECTIYNSTANGVLARRCKEAEVPVIGFHGLRHTHASMLLASGVSIASVSRRLGHASIDITQKVYLHIVKELESKDTDAIMRSMATLL